MCLRRELLEVNLAQDKNPLRGISMNKKYLTNPVHTCGVLENLKAFLDCIGEGVESSGQALGATIITTCFWTNRSIQAFGVLVISLKGVYYTLVGLTFLLVLIYGSLGG